MKHYKREILFGYPIHRIRIDPDSYDKNKIVSDIKKNYEIDINYSQLRKVYSKTFSEFFANFFEFSEPFNYHWNIVNYTAIKTGQYMKAHTHPEYDFSCTHYINFDSEKHSSIRFVKQ